MAPPSLAAQKITSNSKLPRGLANDPPPSPTISKIASAIGGNGRLKSNPAPQGPKRKNSSYNFKHTDPPGTSLLNPIQPLIAPLALSPTPLGVTPATPLLAAAATGFTPPVPPNLDLSERIEGIKQPVPVRPCIRQGNSYCNSAPTPLPAIDETKVYGPGQGSSSPQRRRRRANSGFFCTFGMDGVEDLPILGRRSSNSGNYDEGWPLPPSHGVERGMNTPGDPRRSSMIAESDLEQVVGENLTRQKLEMAAPVAKGEAAISARPDAGRQRPCEIQRMQSDVAAMLARDEARLKREAAEDYARALRERESSAGSSTETVISALRDSSGDDSTVTTQPMTVSSSATNLTVPPLDELKKSLSRVMEEREPSSASGTGTKYFDFSPSFNSPASRKPSEGEGLSPHTRQNSPVEEVVAGPSIRPELHPLTTQDLIGLEEAREGDGSSTENDDWHSIRSHMTRITTAGANSIIFNYSMATPNMPLPTPEELQAQHDEKMRKQALEEQKRKDQGLYVQNVAKAVEGKSPNDFGSPTSETPGKEMSTLGKLRSAASAYPFPTFLGDKKNKGKERSRSPNPPWERPRSSFAQRSLVSLFKGNDIKLREEKAREAAEAEMAVEEQFESFHNRKVDIGPSDDEEEVEMGREWKSPWAEPEEGVLLSVPELELGDDPFHDIFATSSSASAIPSLTSSTVNYIRKDKGKGKEKEMFLTPPLSALPDIRVGQVPIMSPALAKLASTSTGGPSGHNRGMVYMDTNGRPKPYTALSHEVAQENSDSSSSNSEDGLRIMTDAGLDAQRKRRARRIMRPGMESRMSTVRDMDIRRASTVEMVRSGATTSRVVVQESRDSRGSMDEKERLVREAKLRQITSKRKRSMGSMARKKSVQRSSDEENGMKRRISTALQGGFGGRKTTTDGRGGIGSADDIPGEEKRGIWSSILDKFRRGSEDNAIASKRKAKKPRPSAGLGAQNQNMAGDAGLAGPPPMISNAGIAIGEGEPMRKKTTSFWRRQIEVDPETGKVPVLKRMQEAIKRGNSSAMPGPPVVPAHAIA